MTDETRWIEVGEGEFTPHQRTVINRWSEALTIAAYALKQPGSVTISAHMSVILSVLADSTPESRAIMCQLVRDALNNFELAEAQNVKAN